MSPKLKLGLTLRLLGPLIQVVGLFLFLRSTEEGTPVLGVPPRVLGLSLFALGLALVIAGILVSMRVRRGRRRGGFDLDLGDDQDD